MNRILAVSFFALLVTLTGIDAWAQASAQINGAVRDQTGAVLPGVEITATQTDTGISRSTITNEAGAYALPNLATGPYRFEASLPGFRTFVQTGLVLQVGSNPVINAVLEVGQVTEQVEVQANAAAVETRSVGVGQIMENQRILELPLDGRNVAALITLAGGAVEIGNAGSAQRSFNAVPLISVAGGFNGGAGFQLDGANHHNWFDNTAHPLPFPDALQEFSTQTSGLSAQVRQSTSVTAVTRSGTNEFHGNLFHFVRNDLFNARSYFATAGSTLKRNQFGGTVGGPIISNKLFFFGGYQGTTLRQDPADSRTFIPTPAMLAGDFTAFASPLCNQGGQITLRAPFVNNRIDPAMYSRAAVNIARMLPQPNNPCGELIFGELIRNNDAQYVGRIDYQRSSDHSLFGRILIATESQPSDLKQGGLKMLGTDPGLDKLAQTYAVGDTYLFGPNVVNAFRLSVNRSKVARLSTNLFDPVAAGINFYPWIEGKVGIDVTGGFSLASTGPSNVISTTYQVSDDLSVVRGLHQIAFGANLARIRAPMYSSTTATGAFIFNGQETGLGAADYLLGRAASFDQSRPNQNHSDAWIVGVYAADSWNVRPRLTLNYGLRWDPFIPKIHPNGWIYNFDYDRFRQGVRSTVYPNAPAGLYYPGDTGFPGKAGYYKQWWKFAPRVGVAWDLQGDGRTSLRASYGLSHDSLPLQWTANITTTPPFGSRVILRSPAGGLDDPWRGVAGGNPFPSDISQVAIFPPSGLYGSGAYDLKQPSASTWNLSIQRQIRGGWFASMSYLGTQGYHLWSTNAINPAIYFPGTFDANRTCRTDAWVITGGNPGTACSTTGNTDARRRFVLENPVGGTLYGSVGAFDDGGTSSYHGLLLTLQRRAAGLNLNGNYTWSHCVGDSDIRPTDRALGGDRVYTKPDDRAFDRGNCFGDRRHVLNLTAVAETPQFVNSTLRALATGWRLSGLFRASTGQYLNVIAGSDRALSGISNQRPDQVLANPFGDKSGSPMTRYLNRSAFAAQPLGTLGNVGFNSVSGPGTWQFDTALSRIFQLAETHRLEVRAEAYNLTNSFRPGNPSTNISDANFGVLRSSREPRILQFALKYVF